MSEHNEDDSSNFIPAFDEDDQLTDLSSLPEDVLAEAMKQLTNPNKPLLVDEVEATITSIAQEQQLQPWENPDDVAVNAATGKNSRSVICPFCLKSLVLLPNAAVFCEKEIFLVHPNATSTIDGLMCTKFFKVTSKMDFENIEVKRAHPGDNFRYLTCGDCGSGPLGVTYDADQNRVFYVSHDRTRYSDRK